VGGRGGQNQPWVLANLIYEEVNLQRSERFISTQVFHFSRSFHHKNKSFKNIFISHFPPFNSVAKNIFRQRNIGRAFDPPCPPPPKSRLCVLRIFLQSINSTFFFSGHHVQQWINMIFICENCC